MESAMSEGTGAEGDGGDANATDKENLEPAKGDYDMDVDGNSLLYCIIHLAQFIMLVQACNAQQYKMFKNIIASKHDR